MFKKLFGPFPDEPLLYGLDKMLGLFKKLNSKSKGNTTSSNPSNPNNERRSDDKIHENVNDVNEQPTTENRETSIHGSDTNLKKMESLSRTSETSKKDENKTAPSNVNEVTEISKPPRAHNPPPVPILRKSSSMECNYTLSKVSVVKKSFRNRHKVYTKKVSSYMKSTEKHVSSGFGDSMDILENHFERKGGKIHFESTIKNESKRQKVNAVPGGIRWKLNRVEDFSKTLNELRHREVIKTEWAVTRITTFDDNSQTYEVIKEDKMLRRSGSIHKIFAIAPNLTTIAYDPFKKACKKR